MITRTLPSGSFPRRRKRTCAGDLNLRQSIERTGRWSLRYAINMAVDVVLGGVIGALLVLGAIKFLMDGGI